MALLSPSSRKGRSPLDAQTLSDNPNTRLRRYLSFTMLFILVLSAMSVILAPQIAPQTFSILRAFRSPLSQGTTAQVHVQEPYRPPMCAPTNPHSPESIKENIWASLTVEEAVDIRSWLSRPNLGLNLTTGSNAKLNDNFIELVETYHPPKSDALAYYNGTRSRPMRSARVVINHGGNAVPVIRNYLVYPIPTTSKTVLQPLNDIYHRPEIPHNAGLVDFNAPDLLEIWSAGLDHVIPTLFGGNMAGLPNDTLSILFDGPWTFDGTFRRTWLQWKRIMPGEFLNPINFFQYVDVSGTDKSLWRVVKVLYNHQLFNSNEEFVRAFNNKTLNISRDPTLDPTWSSRSRKGIRRDLDHIAGPRSVSFDGLRFRVHKEKKYVSWMGWSFYLGFDRDMGLSFWNIHFLGERIIYELSPQEALAQYSGSAPRQATTVWLDRYFGMGAAVFEMIPGYDCPHEAVYLPSTIHLASGSSTTTRAICIFEKDSGRPLTRHFGMQDGETGSTKDYVLTVRSISTVGNYDYLFDYMFMLDGSIEVRVSASGYLWGAYWEPSLNKHGARINSRSMGSLHDHVMNFKVDFDIVGLNNSVLETTTSIQEADIPWDDEDWKTPPPQQVISRRYIESEDESRLFYPPNFRGGYAIVNRDTPNAWGVPRGYVIHPGYSPIHNSVVGSRRMLNNANFAKSNLAITKRKDNELSSSSQWNLQLPGAPPVDFDRFFDGESLVQEDIVAWINVGMHHFPQAEDAPNTRTNVAASSFILSPFNYFDYDVSVGSSNSALLTRSENGVWASEEYGVKPGFCVPPEVPALEYSDPLQYDVEGIYMPSARRTSVWDARHLHA